MPQVCFLLRRDAVDSSLFEQLGIPNLALSEDDLPGIKKFRAQRGLAQSFAWDESDLFTYRSGDAGEGGGATDAAFATHSLASSCYRAF